MKTKKPWTGTEYQTPIPKIEVFLPTNTSPSKCDFTFAADVETKKLSNKLLGYSFIESVDDLEGSFSFTIPNGECGGVSMFDLIPKRSVVKIFEGEKYARFTGIIRRRKISKQMTPQGIRRTITFSGKNIINCIVDFTLSLDMKIQGVTNARAKNMQMLKEIDNIFPLSITTFMKKTWEYFLKISKDVSEKANGISTIALERIINKYIGDDPNKYITVTGKETKFRYPISGVLINTGNNTITDIWRDKLPQPVYELFAYCENGQPKIMARQVPFGDPENGCSDWKNLKIYQISPISLISYDLEQNDEEVYTAFASYIAGSQRDRNFYMAINQDGQEDTTVQYSEKINIYGFRPLQITFNGYSKVNNTDTEEGGRLTETMQKLNKLAAYWYSRNDDMYSGSITLCTDFKNPEHNPRTGCRAKFLGGEFYINKAEHSWTYGSTPIIRLSVSRGMVYDGNGMMDEGEIQGVGRQFRELENNPSIIATGDIHP